MKIYFDHNKLNVAYPFVISQLGETIYINDETRKAIIEDVNDGINYYADKYIVTNDIINTGDIIVYNNLTYIIISQIAGDKDYYKARMRLSNYNIKFNFDGNIVEVPSIIESIKFSREENQYLTLLNDTIKVTIRDSKDIAPLKIEDRFIKMGSPWIIEGIDRCKRGIIELTCKKDSILPTDDMDNEIVDSDNIDDGGETTPEEIVITGSDTVNMYQNQTYTSNVEVNWSISNSNASIVSQTTTSITLQGVTIGSVVLRAELVGDSSIFTEKQIQVKSVF